MVWLGLCLAHPTTPITNFDYYNYPKPPFHPHSVVDPSAFQIFFIYIFYFSTYIFYFSSSSVQDSLLSIWLWFEGSGSVRSCCNTGRRSALSRAWDRTCYIVFLQLTASCIQNFTPSRSSCSTSAFTGRLTREWKCFEGNCRGGQISYGYG